MTDVPAFIKRGIAKITDGPDTRHARTVPRFDEDSVAVGQADIRSPPVEFIPHRSRRLSDAAAAAAQQWEELENELAQLKALHQIATTRISILEEANEIHKDDLMKLEIQRDYYQRRCIRLLTFVEQIGHLTVAAAKDNEPPIVTTAVTAAHQPIDSLTTFSQKAKEILDEAATKEHQDTATPAIPNDARSEGR